MYREGNLDTISCYVRSGKNYCFILVIRGCTRYGVCSLRGFTITTDAPNHASMDPYLKAFDLRLD